MSMTRIEIHNPITCERKRRRQKKTEKSLNTQNEIARGLHKSTLPKIF